MERIFFDTEFTGLHQKTTLVSIGLIADSGKQFYAELNDFDKTQIDDWLQENVIDNLDMQTSRAGITRRYEHLDKTVYFGDIKGLKNALTEWFSEFGEVEIWTDCLVYDWMLFNEIFGHAFNIPKNVYYIPFDICTVFKDSNIDPDINREEFAFEGEEPKDAKKHNALWDAIVIKKCFERLNYILCY